MGHHPGDQAGSLKSVAWAARGLLIANLVAGGVSLALLAVVYMARLPSPIIVGALGLAAIAQVIAALGCVVAVSIWIYRAHRNLRVIGLDGLNFSPGWAVGSFFVPIVNWFIPFQAMRELYNRSMGEGPHLAHESAPDVTSWWTCFVVSGLIQSLLMAMVAIERVTPLYFTTPPVANVILQLFAAVLSLGAAFLLQKIIGDVTRAQMSGSALSAAFS